MSSMQLCGPTERRAQLQRCVVKRSEDLRLPAGAVLDAGGEDGVFLSDLQRLLLCRGLSCTAAVRSVGMDLRGDAIPAARDCRVGPSFVAEFRFGAFA
jgi:hypothetical protein